MWTRVPLFVLAGILLVRQASAVPADTSKGKDIVDEGAGPSSPTPSDTGALVAHRHLNELQLLDPPPTNPFDPTPLSFDDVVDGRYLHTPIASTHISQLTEAENDPTTLLLADDTRHSVGPIVDLTNPRSYRSFNALVHRYRMVNFYRILPDGSIDARSLFFSPRAKKLLSITRGAPLVALQERISKIEHIRRNYGDNVAWARFHRPFTPVSRAVRESGVQVQPTWKDILATGFYQTPIRGRVEEIRTYFDTHRMAKFISIDGMHFLGIRIDADGIASHLEAPMHQFHP